MTMPIRIQRQRTPGWVTPAGAVYVGRPTPFGNPFRFGKDTSPAARRAAVERFAGDLAAGRLPITARSVRKALAGRALVCWCAIGDWCHADVLLRIANPEATP